MVYEEYCFDVRLDDFNEEYCFEVSNADIVHNSCLYVEQTNPNYMTLNGLDYNIFVCEKTMRGLKDDRSENVFNCRQGAGANEDDRCDNVFNHGQVASARNGEGRDSILIQGLAFVIVKVVNAVHDMIV